MKKVTVIFGTRPEAIKMCPLVNELKKRKNIITTVCVSGQHRDMVKSVTEFFSVKADIDLSVMREGQSLSSLTERILSGMSEALRDNASDLILVHGDTVTAFAAALAGFYERIPIGHVEAGLRTYDADSPFPEEFNRRAISVMAKYHFAPTEVARENLIREGVDVGRIFVTGNTVTDALKYTVSKRYDHPLLRSSKGKRLVLLTVHRRENRGEPMVNIFTAVRKIVKKYADVEVVYPMHMDPDIRRLAKEYLFGCDGIRITEPLSVMDFHNFLARSYAAITDSGGIQEEAAFLGIPVLVARENTERPEGISSGNLMTVGTDVDRICNAFDRLSDNGELYMSMSQGSMIYGDGRVSERIADIIEKI